MREVNYKGLVPEKISNCNVQIANQLLWSLHGIESQFNFRGLPIAMWIWFYFLLTTKLPTCESQVEIFPTLALSLLKYIACCSVFTFFAHKGKLSKFCWNLCVGMTSVSYVYTTSWHLVAIISVTKTLLKRAGSMVHETAYDVLYDIQQLCFYLQKG